MKVYLFADKWIPNESDTAWLACSYKMHPEFKKRFEELGFEIVDTAPERNPPIELSFQAGDEPDGR